MFTVLHTNDFHNHLNPDQGERLHQLRAKIEGSGLLLDAGDAGGSGNILFRRVGEPILELMSWIGYDAMTVGNRDFHFTRIGFTSKLFRASFPVLCANIRPAKHTDMDERSQKKRRSPENSFSSPHSSSSPLPVLPYILKTMTCQMRVIVVGLTVPMITDEMWERRISAYLFDDPIESAKRLVPQLRIQHQPDLLIALTHIGIDHDRRLAETVPGIDLIVGGHTHSILDSGERVGDTLIVQAGCFGKYVGIVEIEHRERPTDPLKMCSHLETL